MKTIKGSILVMIVMAVAITLATSACSGNQKKEAPDTEMEHKMEGEKMDHKDHMKDGDDQKMKEDSKTLAYACPMHPEETGKKGDKCSKCGMALDPESTEE